MVVHKYKKFLVSALFIAVGALCSNIYAMDFQPSNDVAQGCWGIISSLMSNNQHMYTTGSQSIFRPLCGLYSVARLKESNSATAIMTTEKASCSNCQNVAGPVQQPVAPHTQHKAQFSSGVCRQGSQSSGQRAEQCRRLVRRVAGFGAAVGAAAKQQQTLREQLAQQQASLDRGRVLVAELRAMAQRLVGRLGFYSEGR